MEEHVVVLIVAYVWQDMMGYNVNIKKVLDIIHPVFIAIIYNVLI